MFFTGKKITIEQLGTFIGQDGSMDMQHGTTYLLRFRVFKDGSVYLLEPINCPYSTLSTFCENWELKNYFAN